MSQNEWTAEERLIAEQAVALQREVLRAVRTAPWGQGLAVTEAAVLQGGHEFLRRLLEQALSAPPEAQKGGSAPGRVAAGKRRASNATRRKR
jgi:hypothetical protein